MGMIERLLRLIKMDQSSRNVRAFLHEYESRPRYQAVTAADVQRLLAADHWNDNLTNAVMDSVNFRIGNTHDHDLEIVAGLPPAIQMVYSTWWLHAELLNGGFHQYFYNQGRFAFMALEGCRLIGAHAHVELLLQAIGVYLREEPTQQLFRPKELTELIEQYVLARKFSDLPSLDQAYYALPEVDGLRAEYMRQHPEEFVMA